MNLEVSQEGSGQPFIDKNTAVLWVVRKFNDIEAAVLSFHQMGLCAPPRIFRISLRARMGIGRKCQDSECENKEEQTFSYARRDDRKARYKEHRRDSA